MLRSIENLNSPTNSPTKKKPKTQDSHEDYLLGMKLLGNENGGPDFKQAFSCFSSAAKQGHVTAQVKLGECYEQRGTKKDLAEAAYWYQEAAKQNHTDAQFNLARCLFHGQGMDLNEKEAIKWLFEAANNGHGPAQTSLGDCFRLGTGIEQNLESAFFFYGCAAEQGHAEAQYQLAFCYEMGNGTKKDLIKATYWYQEAAKQNHTDAQFNLARCLFHGQGMDLNEKEAIKWLFEAANNGHGPAQTSLGDCFRLGRGVKQNLESAFFFYGCAAEQGHAEAQYQLAFCYEMGNGVKKDLGLAFHWYKKAAEKGLKAAHYTLGWLLFYGQGTVKDPKKAAECFAAGAAQGDALAQYHLGICYATGKGVTQDDQVAFDWFQQAALNNHPESKCWLNKTVTVTAYPILEQINQSNEYYLPKQFPPIADQDGPICGQVSFANNVNYAKKRQFFPTQNTKKMAGGDISDTNDIILDQLQSPDSPCLGTDGPIYSVEVFTYLAHYFGLSGCGSVLNDPEKDFTEKEYTQLLCEAIQQNYVLTVACEAGGFMPTLAQGKYTHWVSLFGYFYDAKGNCNFVGTHKGAYVVWPADGEKGLYESTKQIPKLNPHAAKGHPADLDKFRLCFFKVKVETPREMLIRDKPIADGENKEPDGKNNERSLVTQCNT